jgi:hypothetical protein
MKEKNFVMALTSELRQLIYWCPEPPRLDEKRKINLRETLATRRYLPNPTKNRDITVHLVLFGALLAGCYIYPYQCRVGNLLWLILYYVIPALAAYFASLPVRWICNKIKKS